MLELPAAELSPNSSPKVLPNSFQTLHRQRCIARLSKYVFVTRQQRTKKANCTKQRAQLSLSCEVTH
eukprot:252891-Chlamydomonas_euryale.AAC.1